MELIHASEEKVLAKHSTQLTWSSVLETAKEIHITFSRESNTVHKGLKGDNIFNKEVEMHNVLAMKEDQKV